MEIPVKGGYVAGTRVKTQFHFGPYVPIVRADDKIIIDQQGAVDYYYSSKVEPLKKRLLSEIMPEDSIVDAPSLVTPLLLKKETIWPPRVSATTTTTLTTARQAATSGLGEEEEKAPCNETDSEKVSEDSSEDIQVLKVVDSRTEIEGDRQKEKKEGEHSEMASIVSEHLVSNRKSEDYVKATIVSNLTGGSRNETKKAPILAIQDYTKSSAANLLFSIGLNRVNEYLLAEKTQSLSRKMRRGVAGLIPEFDSTKTRLQEIRRFNTPYKSKELLNCHLCAFKTESRLVLDQHLECPHRNSARFFLCNWCTFKTKDATQIIYHNHVVHKKLRCRVERPMSIHCCRYCSFESNSKRKFSSHIMKCEQAFQPDQVQASSDPSDLPGLTAKFITQHDIKIYECTLKSLRLAAYNPHQIKVTSPTLGFINQPILLLPQHRVTSVRHPNTIIQPMSLARITAPYADLREFIGKGNAGSNKAADSNHTPRDGSQLMRLLSQQASADNLRQNRVAMLQYPKPQSSFSNGFSVAKNVSSIVMGPQNSTSVRSTGASHSDPIEIDLTDEEVEAADNPNGTFLICEICDAYISDLDMFKSHMYSIHKVKIHHKLNPSIRPPLNCQKCDWRFFTDQGLERHLLGAHSLVTANLQELADKEKDAGRCTVCGVRCPRKIVAHMKDFHKMSLKPAQLSYKCTVCSATFSLYRHFENHVYRVHADKIRDKK